MNRREKIKQAHEAFKRVMVNEVTGPGTGAYFATSLTEDAGMGITFGGRVDLAGMAISHALAKYCLITPGLDEDFINTVAGYATELYRESKEGLGELQ
jgi:hypothetical protein